MPPVLAPNMDGAGLPNSEGAEAAVPKAGALLLVPAVAEPNREGELVVNEKADDEAAANPNGDGAAGLAAVPNGEGAVVDPNAPPPKAVAGAAPKAGADAAPKPGVEAAPNAGADAAPNGATDDPPNAGVDEPNAGAELNENDAMVSSQGGMRAAQQAMHSKAWRVHTCLKKPSGQTRYN